MSYQGGLENGGSHASSEFACARRYRRSPALSWLLGHPIFGCSLQAASRLINGRSCHVLFAGTGGKTGIEKIGHGRDTREGRARPPQYSRSVTSTSPTGSGVSRASGKKRRGRDIQQKQGFARCACRGCENKGRVGLLSRPETDETRSIHHEHCCGRGLSGATLRGVIECFF